MHGLARWLTILLASAALSGCLYVNATSPLDTNMNRTPLGTKTGEASRHSVLWLVAWGDGGSDAAARNGGLKVIHNADTRTQFYFFGVYARATTIVYGD
jgi:hypothetical protein